MHLSGHLHDRLGGLVDEACESGRLPATVGYMQRYRPAPSGEATFISIVLTDPGTRLTAPEHIPSALVASWATPSRGTVSVIATYRPYDDSYRSAVAAALPQVTEQMATHIGDRPVPDDPDRLRLVFWLDADDAGIARIVEVGVEMGRC